MILTTYDRKLHGPLTTNLASGSKINSEFGDIFQVVEDGEKQVFVQFERFSWESLEKDAIEFDDAGSGIWIRYFASNAELNLNVNALKIAVLDYLDVFYLDGVGIEFEDDEMTPKKFAEIVHGFQTQDRFAPFLKLQWQPHRTQKGIRFTFQPKR